MNIIIVYDSIFGNTAKIARAVADQFEPDHQIRTVSVHGAKGLDLSDTALLIIGSPTRGFRPTPQISEYIASLTQIPDGMTAAVFDTRLDPDCIDPPPLRWVVEVGGYAAARMASALQDHGIAVRGDLGGFLVTGTEGPLKAGELGRASEWAISLLHD